MAVDKEGISLSRVYSYYYNCNLPFLCVTRLNEILVYSIIEHIITTYGVRFSNLFTELQISPIEVHISPIQLQISPIQLPICNSIVDISK